MSKKEYTDPFAGLPRRSMFVGDTPAPAKPKPSVQELRRAIAETPASKKPAKPKTTKAKGKRK